MKIDGIFSLAVFGLLGTNAHGKDAAGLADSPAPLSEKSLFSTTSKRAFNSKTPSDLSKGKELDFSKAVSHDWVSEGSQKSSEKSLRSTHSSGRSKSGASRRSSSMKSDCTGISVSGEIYRHSCASSSTTKPSGKSKQSAKQSQDIDSLPLSASSSRTHKLSSASAPFDLSDSLAKSSSKLTSSRSHKLGAAAAPTDFLDSLATISAGESTVKPIGKLDSYVSRGGKTRKSTSRNDLAMDFGMAGPKTIPSYSVKRSSFSPKPLANERSSSRRSTHIHQATPLSHKSSSMRGNSPVNVFAKIDVDSPHRKRSAREERLLDIIKAQRANAVIVQSPPKDNTNKQIVGAAVAAVAGAIATVGAKKLMDKGDSVVVPPKNYFQYNVNAVSAPITPVAQMYYPYYYYYADAQATPAAAPAATTTPAPTANVGFGYACGFVGCM